MPVAVQRSNAVQAATEYTPASSNVRENVPEAEPRGRSGENFVYLKEKSHAPEN